MTTERDRSCPTPEKRHRTWSPALAQLLAETLTASKVGRYQAYPCRCGDWHIRDAVKKNQRGKARKKARRRARRPLEVVMMIAEHAEWLP